MFNIPKIYLKIAGYVLLAIIILIVWEYVSEGIAGLISAILIVLGLKKSKQDKIDDAKENVEKAGEDIEKPDKHTADSALNKFDDFFDNNPR